jgi:hypothetical protein
MKKAVVGGGQLPRRGVPDVQYHVVTRFGAERESRNTVDPRECHVSRYGFSGAMRGGNVACSFSAEEGARVVVMS